MSVVVVVVSVVLDDLLLISEKKNQKYLVLVVVDESEVFVEIVEKLVVLDRVVVTVKAQEGFEFPIVRLNVTPDGTACPKSG